MCRKRKKSNLVRLSPYLPAFHDLFTHVHYVFRMYIHDLRWQWRRVTVFWLDYFPVPFKLPAVRAVQGDCQWPLENDGNYHRSRERIIYSWWRHQMETFSALLAFCAENSVTGDALMFSLISAWTNSWANKRDAGVLRRHSAHYDVIVMCKIYPEFIGVEVSPKLYLDQPNREPVTSSILGRVSC